mmetsp:Transcript_63217/g.99878  ORF Transcript_63217/g.99878 Transcript_63217/m.99878 type:complete len:108 (+) Transcript_63217:76-399(+)
MRTFACFFALLLSVAATASLRSAVSAPEGGQEIKYDEKQFKESWHNEWRQGDFPSYKETYSKDTFPGRAAVVAAEDDQSDGKPGEAGLKGADVGAYLKHHEDGTIER